MVSSRAVVVDESGSTVSVLPTWSDAALVAEALGMQFIGHATSHGAPEIEDPPEMIERITARWPDVTDLTWHDALTRLVGRARADAWRTARLGPHPTLEAARTALATYRAQYDMA